MSKVITFLPSLVQIRPQWDPDPDTGNKPEQITWWMWRSSGTPTLANLTAAANEFDSVWGGTWQSMGPSTKHYIGCIVTDFSSSFGLQYSSVGTLTPKAGVETGGCLPPNVAVLLSYKTGEHFKGGHFRQYWPYLASGGQSASDPSMITSTLATSLTAGYVLIEPGMNGVAALGGLTQRCYRHRYTPATARLDPITTFTFNLLLATQRRRLRKAPHK